MPIYEFECSKCFRRRSGIYRIGELESCCGRTMKKLPGAAAIIIPGNMGGKLRTRVALDDELRTQGYDPPLFSSPERKDQWRWALKKEGVK